VRRFLSHKAICIPTYDRPDSICDFVYQTANELAAQNVVIILALGENWRGRSGWHRWRRTISSLSVLKEGNAPQQLALFQFLPLQRFSWLKTLNITLNYFILARIIEHHTRNKERLLWIFHPREQSLVSFFSNWKVYFDCVDWHSSYDTEKRDEIDRERRELLKMANAVTSITTAVQDRILATSQRRVPIVPQGFDLEGFLRREQLSPELEKQLEKTKGRPVIGFFGGVNQRLDISLLTAVIERHPEWDFWFVGSRGQDENVGFSEKKELDLEKLLSQPNVIWISSLRRAQLLPIMKKCDVLTIPYDLQWEFNQCCFPMKVMEYFYVGKPIVSTPLPSLTPYTDILFGQTVSEFEKMISQALKQAPSKRKLEKGKKIALAQTWKRKIDSVDVYLDKVLPSP